MDRLNQINQILDSCLTTETLNQVNPSGIPSEDMRINTSSIQEQHRQVQIALLEKVGLRIESELEDTLKDQEVALVCQRIDQFLIKRGFFIRPVL